MKEMMEQEVLVGLPGDDVFVFIFFFRLDFYVVFLAP